MIRPGQARDILSSRTSIVVGETLATSLLGFLTFALIVRATDLDTVGLWVLINSLLGFSRAADVWSRGVSSFVAQARAEESDAAAVGYVTTAALSAAVGYLLTALIAGGVFSLILPWLVQPHEEAIVRQMLPLMLITFWLMSMATVYQLGFLGFSRPLYKAVQTIGGNLIFLAGTAWLAPAMGITGLLLAQIFQGAAMLVFAVVALHFRLAPVPGLRLWDRAKFGQLAIFGGKATAIGALQLATEPILRLLANHFGGASSVALVDLASRIVQVVRGIVSAIGQNLIPSFARITRADPAEQTGYFLHTRHLIVLLAVPLMGGAIVASAGLGILVLGRYSPQLTTLTLIIGLGWLTSLLSSPAYFLLFGWRLIRPLMATHIAMVAGMVILGGFAGWIAGLMGAMVGGMAGVAIASLTLTRTANRHLSQTAPALRWTWPDLIPFTPILLAALVPFVIMPMARSPTSAALLATLSLAGVVMFTLVNFPFSHALKLVRNIDN